MVRDGSVKTRNPKTIISAFDCATELLTRLMRTEGRKRGPGSHFKNLAVETRMRLIQATTLLTRCHDAELQLLKSSDEGWRSMFMSEVRLNGEAFYYFAFRAREALEKFKHVDTHVNLDFDPEGVRIVRNKLIEDHDLGRILRWKITPSKNLVLIGDDRHEDRGLYPNADQYITKLLRKLTACPYVREERKNR